MKLTCNLEGLSNWITVLLLSFFWFSSCFIEIQCWPEGTYGIPMAESGCPHSTNFEWLTGSRTQMTEKGSHGSENGHLAGIQSTKNKADNKIVQNFCIKTSFLEDGEYTWQPGKYCIYKKDTCPENFDEGHVYWDDNVPLLALFGESKIQDYSGTLPDGLYDKNTDIYFCCRTDGSANEQIELPTVADFYLLQYGRQCQKIKGMTSTEEWVFWAGENTFNFDDEGGTYPRLTRAKFPTKYTRLYYCYYSQKPVGSSLQTALNVVYVIAGVVAVVIFSFVVMCLIQRCHSSKYHETPHNAENTGGPILQYTRASNNDNNTHCLVYNRPPSISSSGVGGESDYTMMKSNSGLTDRLVPTAPPPPREETIPCHGIIPSPPSYDEVIFQRITGDPV